jgi:Ca2+-binding RTX toxin-like protein
MTVRLPLTLAVALLVLVPSGAQGAAIVGSSLPEPTGETLACDDAGGCTFVPTNLSGAPVAVPSDGVIVRWAVRSSSGATPDPVDLRVLRPAPDGQLSAGGITRFVMPAAGSIVEVPARDPVRAGDLIAVDLDDGEELGIATHATFDSESSLFLPRLGAAETRAPTVSGPDDFEALFQAVVEPDADGDGFGDETQDRCPQLSETRGPCRNSLTGRFALQPGVSGGNPLTVLAGDDFRVRALADNWGPHRVPGVFLSIVLPPEVAPVAAPATCLTARDRITCALNTLAPGTQAGVEVTLRALRPGTGVSLPNQIPPVSIRAELAGGLPGRARLGGSMFVRILATGVCSNSLAGHPIIGLTVTGTFAGDRIAGGTKGDTLLGLAGDDCLHGNKGDDILRAGGGDDRLAGGRGRDTLSAGAGDDRLAGGPDRDTLRGEAGRDHLTGGPARDRLTGGEGHDALQAVDGSRDLVRCGGGRDVARVDRSDSVAGCERVRRVSRPKPTP